MTRIFEIEETLRELLEREQENSWHQVAELILSVEQGELWREQRGVRSFSVWIEALAKKIGVSKSWPWKIYRAGLQLRAIVDRRTPGVVMSLPDLGSLYPAVSVNGLNTLGKIRNTRVSQAFVEYAEDEYFEGKIQATALERIAKEIIRCKRLGLPQVELMASLHKVNLGEILGEPGARVKLITATGVSGTVDALGVLLRGAVPEYLAIKVDAGDRVAIRGAFDWSLTIEAFPRIAGRASTNPDGHLLIDPLSGRVEILAPPRRLRPDPRERDKLSTVIVASLLQTETEKTAVQTEDTEEENS